MTARRTFVNITPPDTTRHDEDTPPPCSNVEDWQRSDWIWYDHGAHEEAEALAAAKVICAPCPIRDACLAKAVANKEDGIWAGTTATQRRALRRGGKGTAVGVRCPNLHDLTLPNATDRAGKCKECRNAYERRARARRAAS